MNPNWIGSALAGSTSKILFAIFALPMIATLVLGGIYLGYSRVKCDPLYLDDPAAAGYKSGSALNVLIPLLPPGYTGNKAIPVPRRDFAACPSAPR